MTVVFTTCEFLLNRNRQTARANGNPGGAKSLRSYWALLAELPIHVTWSNTEQVKKALRDLQTAGFISGYVSGQGVSQWKRLSGGFFGSPGRTPL